MKLRVGTELRPKGVLSEWMEKKAIVTEISVIKGTRYYRVSLSEFSCRWLDKERIELLFELDNDRIEEEDIP